MSPFPFPGSRLQYGLCGCVFAAWIALAGCEGSATQTTTGKALEGVLVDPQGHPVGGATVRAWPAVLGPVRGGAPDTAGAYSARTDARGHYAITDLEVGVYNLFGANPANRATVLIPRVKYLEKAADLGVDTLKAPGAIVGRVTAGGGAPPAVFCYLEGSNYAAIADATGRFVLPDLAEGTYRLNYFSEGYARATDSVVTVRSGDTTVVADRLLAPDLALQPPAPQGISASYDPVYGTVKLAWSPVRVGDFKEYVLEYEDSPRTGPVYPEGYVRAFTTDDTVYSDRMLDYFRVNGISGTEFTRKYWVRAKDSEGNLSPKPADPVSLAITVPSIYQTEFTLAAVADPAGAGGCRDTLPFALDVVSAPDSLVQVQWLAKGYYRYPWDAGAWMHGETPPAPIGVSTGAPHRDTVSLTRAVLEGLEIPDSRAVFDSVKVVAQIQVQGVLIHGVLIPVGVDSAGCFRPRPGREISNSKPVF